MSGTDLPARVERRIVVMWPAAVHVPLKPGGDDCIVGYTRGSQRVKDQGSFLAAETAVSSSIQSLCTAQAYCMIECSLVVLEIIQAIISDQQYGQDVIRAYTARPTRTATAGKWNATGNGTGKWNAT